MLKSSKAVLRSLEAVLCPLMLLVPATTSLAAEFYVSPSGSDGNRGTPAFPFATILRASQAVAPGDTVHVGPGTYAGGFRTTAHGTASAPIIYVSDVRWQAVIVPPVSSKSEFGWDQRGDHVVIDGFQVDGADYKGGRFWTVGLNLAGAHSSVRSSHVHGIMTDAGQTAANGSHGGAGIMLEGYYGATDISAIGNVVHTIGPSDRAASGARYIHGIYASSGHDYIANNIVYHVSCDAVSNYHDATDNVIVNNTLVDARSGIDIAAGGVYHLAIQPDRFFLANNIVYRMETGIVERGGVGMHNVITHKLLGKNRRNWSLKYAVPEHTVVAEPGFVGDASTEGRAFRLMPGSPAIDAGTATHAPAYDITGSSRQQGAGYDIGAYQFRPSAAQE
jgi:hypothetical protein